MGEEWKDADKGDLVTMPAGMFCEIRTTDDGQQQIRNLGVLPLIDVPPHYLGMLQGELEFYNES